jgi:hypothetical protein
MRPTPTGSPRSPCRRPTSRRDAPRLRPAPPPGPVPQGDPPRQSRAPRRSLPDRVRAGGPPRAERSTGTASPPLPCARGSSGAPSRPPQKRSARSGSSAGNSIKAGLDRAIGTTLRQPAGLDDPDPGRVRPRRNAATRPLGSTELRLSEQPLDQIEVLDQLRMARNSSRTRSQASRPTEPARSTARCVFAGAGWVRVGACDSAAERCPWRRSHFGSCS